MNPIFSDLTEETLADVEDLLSNNEAFSDDELIDFFIEELDLTPEQAVTAVSLRGQYLGQLFLAGEGPLHQDYGISFDPRRLR